MAIRNPKSKTGLIKTDTSLPESGFRGNPGWLSGETRRGQGQSRQPTTAGLRVTDVRKDEVENGHHRPASPQIPALSPLTAERARAMSPAP